MAAHPNKLGLIAAATAALLLGLPQALPAHAQSTSAKQNTAAKAGTKKSQSKSATKPQAKSDAKSKAKSVAKSKSATKSAAKPASKPQQASGAKKGAAVSLGLAAGAAAALPAAGRTDGTRGTGSTSAHLGNPSVIPQPATTIITAAAIDVAAVKRAIELVRNGRHSEAYEVRRNISDPAAKKLVEWVILRSDNSGADFAAYAAFIAANPHWPSVSTLRRRAEAAAWQERLEASRLLAYLGQWPALSPRGRFAHARALLARGDRRGAESLVRETWRTEGFSEDVEKQVIETFGNMLTRADHKARMTRRLYEKDDTDAGLRAAQRLGGHEVAIAKARIAALGKGNAKAALDAVPAAARDDIGYKFARIQMLRRADHTAEAVALIKTVPKQLDDSHDHDEWWIARRVLARTLLDEGKPKDAYVVVRDATLPTRSNYRAEHHFMAGWIALRYLHDPATAYSHFAQISNGNENPISLARGAYWQGRAAEAMHRPQDARRHYADAARYPTAYYGQIARAKAGLGELTLNRFPSPTGAERTRAAQSDVVRSAELLYAVEARELAWILMADMGDKSNDVAVLALLAELTAKYRDARGMLLVGKLALGRGVPLDHAAFPTIGVPAVQQIGPPVDPALVYSIVRQESWFNPKTVSSANALGLMQVTPPTGRYLAKKYNANFDQKRLLNDNVYNVQLGSAELGENLKDYRGSYIMAFAAYNAGRGRVKEWVARYGDPRDPRVDPIDWVERIPFSETRNYVQRVMENFQVYRLRFGGSTRLTIEADLRRGAAEN